MDNATDIRSSSQSKDESLYLLEELKLLFPEDHLLKKYGKSFYFAHFFLSTKHAQRANTLYETCRLLDDIVDNPQIGPHEARELLNHVEGFIRRHSYNKKIALTQDCLVSEKSLLDLIQGLHSDIEPTPVANQTTLLNYCYKVAGTVGLMMCDIFDIQLPIARKHAIDLGIAMQLTNISRDVWLDLQLGRLYLPQENIGTYTANTIDLNNNDHIHTINKAIQDTLVLADSFYQSGIDGLQYVPTTERFGLYIAAKLYQKIGDKVRKNGYLTLNAKSYVPFYEKIIILVSCFKQFCLNPTRLEDTSKHNLLASFYQELEFYQNIYE